MLFPATLINFPNSEIRDRGGGGGGGRGPWPPNNFSVID